MREWGISRRTLCRDVAHLRAAGVIIDLDYRKPRALCFIGFDSLYPESVREAANRLEYETREREERLIAESLDRRALVENARREKKLAATLVSENRKSFAKARREARQASETDAQMMFDDACYRPVR
jgi:hypothetical protein